jgi:hypothetical protein
MLPLNNTKEGRTRGRFDDRARAGKRKDPSRKKPTQKHDNSIVPEPLFSLLHSSQKLSSKYWFAYLMLRPSVGPAAGKQKEQIPLFIEQKFLRKDKSVLVT